MLRNGRPSRRRRAVAWRIAACTKAGVLAHRALPAGDQTGEGDEPGLVVPARLWPAAPGPRRYHHWTVARREQDRLTDLLPGGHPVHGLLDWERAVIVDLFEAWGEIDRSHRKLAHRGSRIEAMHVSESTLRRVLAAQGLS